MSAEPQSLFDAPAREPSILEKHLQHERYSPVHRRDPDTAVEAAKKAQDRAPILREKVLLVLAEARDGLTDFEIAEALDCLRTSSGKRRLELQQLGLCERTELRRMTDTGTGAYVHRVTEDGLRLAQRLQQKGGSE